MRRSNARSQAFDPDPTNKMDASKLQLRPPATRFSLFSRISSPNPKHSRRNLWMFLAAVSTVSVFLYLFIVSRGPSSSSSSPPPRFGIIIDGGSTGTRIHVFGYAIGRGMMPVIDFGSTATTKVSPGLSSYSGDPGGAGESLVELLAFGRERVPEDQWGDTEIRLMATAGLRLLDAGVRERILESCRRVLRSSGFRFQDDWATVISGSDEGIYAWVAANYALGTLGGDPLQTTGVIELGGASAQVTFVSSEPLPPEFLRVLKFGEATYNLYSHSFLHFGQNVAYESLRELLSSRDLKLSSKSVHEGIFIDPCTPRGYSRDVESLKVSASVNSKTVYHPTAHSVGNFSECRSAALMLLQKEKDQCLYQHCLLGSTFIPKLQGRFLATENFFYTSKFFGLGSTSFLSDLLLAGKHFCEEDWLKLKKKYQNLAEEDLLQYCFSSAYIVALLHDSLGIALNDKRIGFANQVGNIQLDWALGAFIMQRTSNMTDEHLDWITGIVRDDSSAMFSLFIVTAVLVITAWFISRWRKPQLKTIYDLEKGRYITTRVNR